jgi:hypothetical protein
VASHVEDERLPILARFGDELLEQRLDGVDVDAADETALK